MAPEENGRPGWARERRDWPGFIAFILAAGLSIGFAAALIMSASSRTPPISQETATLLSTLGGAMVGAVATYLGMARRDQMEARKEVDDVVEELTRGESDAGEREGLGRPPAGGR